MNKTRIRKYNSIIIFLILNLIFYGCYVVHHYAADTYLTELLPWQETVTHYFMNGRWLMSGFAYLCKIFNISHTTEQLLSWGTAILSISLSSTLIYNLFLEKNKTSANTAKGVWGILASFMLVSNVFMVEYFIFAEYTGMICLGILFTVIGAKFILKFMEQKKPCYYFMGVTFAILGINGHQGGFAIFLIICTVFSWNMFENVKTFVLNNLIIGSAYLIPCLVDMWECHIGGASRITHGLNIAASFKKATVGLASLSITTANFMYWGSYVIFITILGIYFLCHIIQRKSWKALIASAYCCIIAILGIYAPLLITDVNFIDVVPRTVYIMGGAIPILLFLMLIHFDLTPRKNVVLSVIIVSFLLTQYYGLTKITTGTYLANAADYYEAQYIGSYLRKYEKETGTTVTKLALYWDKDVSGFAHGVTGYAAINERVMTNDWAAPLAIQCLDGYAIEMAPKSDEVYNTYFKDKDWTHMDEEQFVVIGDTLHLCAY